MKVFEKKSHTWVKVEIECLKKKTTLTILNLKVVNQHVVKLKLYTRFAFDTFH